MNQESPVSAVGTDGQQSIPTDHSEAGDGEDLEFDVAQAILESAIRQIESVGASKLQVEQVLADTGASADLLQQLFGSRRDLVQAAEYERHHRRVEEESLARLEPAEAATTSEEFFAYIVTQLTRIATDPTSRSARLARVQSATNVLERPDLLDQFGARQRALLDVLAQVFERAKARGIINPDLDSYGYAAWFHGANLGMTLTEGSLDDSQRWLAIAIPAALAPLRIPDQSIKN